MLLAWNGARMEKRDVFESSRDGEREGSEGAARREEGRDIIYGAVGWVGAGVPCIDSTSFWPANEWLVLCPQMYGNAGRELFLNIRRYR